MAIRLTVLNDSFEEHADPHRRLLYCAADNLGRVELALRVFDGERAIVGLAMIRCVAFETHNAALLANVTRFQRCVESNSWSRAYASFDELRSEVVLALLRFRAAA